MVSFTTATALFVVSALSATVSAQSAPNCVYASWASNGDNQNPCQIWQALGQKCDASFTVTALEPGTAANGYNSTFYPAPTGSGANNCQCSHIAYSLMAACSWCQEGVYSIDGWLGESDWQANCGSNYNSQGISSVDTSGLNIPPYATQPVPGPVWDPTDAQAAQVRLGSNGNANGSTGNGNNNNGNSSSNAALTRSIGVVSSLLAVAPVTYLLF